MDDKGLLRALVAAMASSISYAVSTAAEAVVVGAGSTATALGVEEVGRPMTETAAAMVAPAVARAAKRFMPR